MPQESDSQLRKYKVYVLLHSCLIAFLAIMALIIASRGIPVPYPKILAPYWAGFFQLLVAVISFVSFFTADLEIRLVLLISHIAAAFVAAGGLIVVTVIDIGANFYFYEGVYATVDSRPALLAIGGLLFLLDFIFVFLSGVSKGYFTREARIGKYRD